MVNNKRLIMLLVISIVIVIAMTAGVTYAYLSVSKVQDNPNTITTTCYEVSYKEESESINIIGYPISTTDAFKYEPYSFTITNDCEMDTEYQILINIKNNTTETLLEHINYSLDGSTVEKLSNLTPVNLPIGAVSENVIYSYIIKSDSLIGKGTNKTYNLHMWIDENAGNEIMGSTFEAEVMAYNVAT